MHGSVRGSNLDIRNTPTKAQKQKCRNGATVESKVCGLALYSTSDTLRRHEEVILSGDVHTSRKNTRLQLISIVRIVS